MRVRSCLLSILFFLLLMRPPISPLFPYTTLFRSVWAAAGDAEGLAAILGQPRAVGLRQVVTEQRQEFLLLFGRQVAAGRDRKSTRLNSSHTVISYAVFCLKKKKKKI